MEPIQVAVEGQAPRTTSHVYADADARHAFQRSVQRASSDPCHEGVKVQVGLHEGERFAGEHGPMTFL